MSHQKEHRPLLYRLTRAVIRAALDIFFEKIDVRHKEIVPDHGPVVFIANHPNSIMDAFVLGVVTKRKVNYIAHAGLFKNPIKRWFLRSSGVIPVYRQQDDPAKMEQNVKMFEECRFTLERGESIGVFPEGTSDTIRKVKKIKTGTARIVLEAEAANDYRLGLKLIPIGLHFYSMSHFRSRVMVNFGEPIDLEPFFEAYRTRGFEGVRELTAEIQKKLQELTVNVRNEELDDFVRDVELIYRDELKTIRERSKKAANKSYREEFIISKAIAECIQYYHDNDPDRLAEYQAKIRAYKRKLERLHLRDHMLRDSVTVKKIWTQTAKAFARAALGFVPAVYGIINNYVPYRIAESFARRFSFERTKVLTALMMGGGMAFLFFYALQTAVVTHYAGSGWGFAYLLSLPIFGFYALGYVNRMRKQRKRISLSFFLFTNRPLIARMRRQRRSLILQLNEIRDEYLQRIQGAANSETAGNA